MAEIIKWAGLSGIDRMLGMMFGFARGVLILAVVIGLLARVGLSQESWWQASMLMGELLQLADWLHMLGTEHAPDLFDSTEPVEQTEES